jgi:hypothetical protein
VSEAARLEALQWALGPEAPPAVGATLRARAEARLQHGEDRTGAAGEAAPLAIAARAALEAGLWTPAVTSGGWLRLVQHLAAGGPAVLRVLWWCAGAARTVRGLAGPSREPVTLGPAVEGALADDGLPKLLISGGWRALCAAVGGPTWKGAPADVRAAVEALRAAGLVSFTEDRLPPERLGGASGYRLLLRLGLALTPDGLARETGAPARLRYAVPTLPPSAEVEALPPRWRAAGARLEAGAVAALCFGARDLAERGGVVLQRAALAEAAGLTASAGAEVWARLGRFAEVTPGRWTLAARDDSERAALELMTAGGRLRLGAGVRVRVKAARRKARVG